MYLKDIDHYFIIDRHELVNYEGPEIYRLVVLIFEILSWHSATDVLGHIIYYIIIYYYSRIGI